MKSNRLYFLPIEAEGGLYTGRQFSYGISYNGGSKIVRLLAKNQQIHCIF